MGAFSFHTNKTRNNMKFYLFSLLTLLILALTVQAQNEGDDFCINFYKNPSYKIEAGVICGSVSAGGGGGTKNGNIDVGSFKAPSFLQVTLYEKPFYQGASHVYKGNQKKISPAVHVGSVKWKHL